MEIEVVEAETVKFNNPWMKLIDFNGHDYIESDGKRFYVTMISQSLNKVNSHCDTWGDRGVIATSEKGYHYVCLINHGQEVTKRKLIKFLKENRDWDKSIPLLNAMFEKFPEESDYWLKHGSTIRLIDLAMRTLEIDKRTVDFDNLMNPLDTGRHKVESGGTLMWS